MLVEHSGPSVGSVNTSWRGVNGEMRVAGYVTDSSVQQRVKSGEMRGLSLGMSTMDTNTQGHIRNVEEVSLCARPARPHCYVTHIDGKRVTQRHGFSASMRKFV